jgi:hypothetical protein
MDEENLIHVFNYSKEIEDYFFFLFFNQPGQPDFATIVLWLSLVVSNTPRLSLV